MKVLFFIDSLGSGGAQRQMVELALGLNEIGFHVSFLTYHKLDFFRSSLDSRGISIMTIEEPNYFKRILKIRRFIRKARPNAVISFLTGPCFISALASLPTRNWKLVVGERSSNPNIVSSLRWRAYRWMHVFADYVVANSFENLRLVKRAAPFLSADKCKVIYNLVDLSKWRPIDEYRAFAGEKVNILIASSHQYLKNLNGLIEGVNGLSIEERAKVRIEWYGEVLDNSFVEGRRKIAALGLSSVFYFFPPSSSIGEKMASCDAVGLFSFFEGLPNALCEGMASGKPILASSVSDNAIILNGDHGLMFDPGNSLSITAALRRLIGFTEKELRAIGEENRMRAQRLFKKDVIINEYLSLLRD